MHVKKLLCRNFRNYKELEIDFSPGINLITGLNAAGKTNILESVYLFSNIKSFRNVSDTELIKRGEDSYFCALNLGNPPYTAFEIGCAVSSSGKIAKKAKIDGAVKKKLSDYFGVFLAVVFSPDDIALVTGPPETRRRFFDSVISKTDSGYLHALSEYKRIIAERNNLLRDIREKKRAEFSELDIWDAMLAERASILLKKRIEFLDTYNSRFRESNLQISENLDSLHIRYVSSCRLFEKKQFFEKEKFIEELIKNRNMDIFSGSTGIGPHRDDYCFVFDNDLTFKNFASQGQKRTAGISLKIAEYKIIENSREKPVILMDDVFGELDDNRKKRIMEIIGIKNQLIISSVNDFLEIGSSDSVHKFHVQNGGIIKGI